MHSVAAIVNRNIVRSGCWCVPIHQSSSEVEKVLVFAEADLFTSKHDFPLYYIDTNSRLGYASTMFSLPRSRRRALEVGKTSALGEKAWTKRTAKAHRVT
jgi:hypothetical protein